MVRAPDSSRVAKDISVVRNSSRDYLPPRLLPSLLLALWGIGMSLSWGGEGDLADLFGAGLQVDGGILDFVREKNAVVIRNYATLTIGPRRIRARNMIYYHETKQVYAEGDVSLYDPTGSSFSCDRLYFNINTWVGRAENLRVWAKAPGAAAPPAISNNVVNVRPSLGQASGLFQGFGRDATPNRVNAYAKDVRILGKDHLEMIDATVTPSMFAKPHWGIYSNAVNLRRGEKIESWHNVLKIGSVPILYFPYVIKDLQYDWPWVRVSGGKDGDWGYWVFAKWGIDLDPNPERLFRIYKLFLDTDWRQERGWGFGAEMEYELGKRRDSWGFIDFYHTKETEIGSNADWERANTDNDYPGKYFASNPRWEPALYRDENRYDLGWWHRQVFTDRLDLRIEAHTSSDRDFLREYFADIYNTEKEPETFLDLRYRADQWQLELVAQARTNDWQNQSEYLPELRFTIPGLKLGETPFYLKSDSRAGIIRRRTDEMLEDLALLNEALHRVQEDGDSPFLARAYNRTEIYTPISLGSWKLQPYAGVAAAAYSKTYDGHFGEEDGTGNVLPLYGFDLSTRVYGLYRENRWRHLVEPTIRFEGQGEPTHDPDRFFNVDAIDNLRESRLLTFALHQKLQEKQEKGIRDFIDLDLKVGYQFVEEEADRLHGGHHWTDIAADLVVRPWDTLSFFGGMKWDPNEGEVSTLDIGLDWRYRDRFRTYLTHRYRPTVYEAWTGEEYESNTTTLALRTQLWDRHSKYAFEYAIRYEHENNDYVHHGLVRQKFTLIRDLDTFELSLSVIDDRAEDERHYLVNLTPKGWVGSGASLSYDMIEAEADSRYSHPTTQADDNPSESTGEEIDMRKGGPTDPNRKENLKSSSPRETTVPPKSP